MSLVLAVRGRDRLDNGEPARLVLDRHGARIGRSPHADWSLPDPRNYISSTHCEVDYRDGRYLLTDRSTNGTFLNGSSERMSAPHPLAHGDVLQIGHYEVEVIASGEAGLWTPPADAPAAAPASPPDWNGWGTPAEASAPAGWDRPPPASAPAAPGWTPSAVPSTEGVNGWDGAAARPAISGLGVMSGAWSAPGVSPPPRAQTPWDQPQAAPPAPSGWSSAAAEASGPPAAVDVWGHLTSSVGVDWARGGFSQPGGEPDPFGLNPHPPEAHPSQGLGLAPAASPAWAAPAAPAGWGETPSKVAPPTGWDQAAPASPPPHAPAGDWAAFAAAAGLAPADVKTQPAQALASAGLLLKRLVAGLVVMLEARARAKAQLGAQGTSLEFAGNNPLKFARSPEQALAQLLNPAERGFMPAGVAVEDAFRDLQAHQVATLSAMQGALAATLARFSPSAIRGRAEMRGVLAKILPSARDATLWQAYEREFEGVAKGSDEAFMEVFAQEFRAAYERVAAEMKPGQGC
jgi:type VI secretion system protein